jgi:hypothetical protein
VYADERVARAFPLVAYTHQAIADAQSSHRPTLRYWAALSFLISVMSCGIACSHVVTRP